MEFESIDAFVAFLEALPAKMLEAAPIGLEGSAKYLEHECKEALGTYQEGWPELSDVTQIERDRWGYPSDEPLYVTGELRSHIEHSVDAGRLEAAVGVPSEIVGEHDSDDMDPHTRYRDIGQVALDQEMGTGHIPARPFLGPTAAKHHDKIAAMVAEPVQRAIAGLPPGKPSDNDIPF
jgi:hypothetical protein